MADHAAEIACCTRLDDGGEPLDAEDVTTSAGA
jgi:hypothetical protein